MTRSFQRVGAGMFLALLLTLGVSAQNVAGTIVGTVVDSTGAVIPGAQIHLVNQGTSAARDAQSDASGVYRFPNLAPGTYRETVTASGFKQNAVTNIQLTASETRDLGKTALQVGNMSEEVTVTAATTPIQTSSSEVSHSIGGATLDALPLRGRDLFGAVHLDAGVLDTSGNRDVTVHGALGGISIDGNTSALNFTVDGQTDMDTGSNGSVHFEPNMDSIQEVKILSSNYAAEYGHNSGGTITVVTKSGTNQYHGTAWWTHRHEEFNANDVFKKASGLSRSIYRYNVDGWSFGGPVPLGWLKDKLFFFGSQEYTNQIGDNVTETRTVPTALERGGDFSQSFDQKGNLIKIYEPNVLDSNGKRVQFPNNKITSGISPVGQAMLNFFPLPNYTPAAGSKDVNQANFQQSASGPHSRRNDVVRVDFNPTAKLSTYFRFMRDADDEQMLYQFTQFNIAPLDHPSPGWGDVLSATYILSPTIINEATIGYSWDTWSWYLSPAAEAQIDRKIFGSNVPPTLFPLPTTPAGVNGYVNVIPWMSFGSAAPNMMSVSNGTYNYFNENPYWTATDNLSMVEGNHQFKFGIYLEQNKKLQPAGQTYNGSYNFTQDSNNPADTGDGYANALLGNFDSFSQATARTTFDVHYWSFEFYGQDSWKATRKLTLDLGVRFYMQTPQVDLNRTFGVFDASLYNKKAVPRIYVPACSVAYTSTSPCPKADQQSTDPGGPAGNLTPAAYIGSFVPGTGDYGNGMKILGVDAPLAPYNQSPIKAAPRIGFAYDVFGNGKTAFRGGFGVFYNRLDGNQVYQLSGQAPLVLNYQVSQGSIATLNSAPGVVSPSTVQTYTAQPPWPVVRNVSLGVQQALPHSTALSMTFVGNYSREQDIKGNLNAIPLGANFNHMSPVTGAALTQVGSSQERTIYPGYQDVTEEIFLGHSNYNALQVSLQHRMAGGFLLGAAYSWAKNMGTTSFDPLVQNNDERNYGPVSLDRQQSLVINYAWQIPGLGKRTGNKFLGAVTDNWTFSGLTTYTTGAPFGVGFSTPGVDYTGSSSEGARINVVSNPYANVPTGMIMNPNAFATPVPANKNGGDYVEAMGNLGVNPFHYPGYNDWDMTIEKFIPLGAESKRGFQVQVEAFNALNHPQFTSYGTTQTSLSSFGKPTADSPGPRVLSLNLRFQF